MTIAVAVAPDGMLKEPLMLPDVPALLPPPRRPLHDDTGEPLLIVLAMAFGCAWKSLASTW